ncbi:MAG TPA: sialate O-acetylesterase, partial [Tepidisphaeraceae bacterium]
MAGELKLPSFFGPNMVLQRNQPLKIWGWAAPGASVEVRFSVRNASVTADAEGRWSAEMESLPAGGPFDLSVKSGDEEKRLSNVLVGDVWICSGQSNMEWTIDALAASHRPKDFPNLPHVRLFTVSHDAAASPKTNVSGVWGVASEKTIRSFSAVGFFFGRQLNETLGVPIGLIATSWGGTAAEAWTPAHAMAKHPDLSYVVEHLQAEAPASEPHEDPGNIGLGAGWAAPDFDDADWPEMALPTYWEDAGLDMDGSVWFRREIDVPLDWSQQDLMLSLGAIDDFDHTYFNGYEIGRTGLETTGWWGVQREYVVPRRL